MTNIGILGFVNPNSALISWMPGTAMELPEVEMKPVKAMVSVIRHFFDKGQLRGLSGEEEKSERV